MPAFMAAEFPPYLRSDGMYEDRYAALNDSDDGSIGYMNARIVLFASRPRQLTITNICCSDQALRRPKSFVDRTWRQQQR